MFTDARYIDDQSVLEGDICIIGAGAAGITIALELNNTPHKVILLEGGGFDYDDRAQELLKGKTTGQPYYPLKSTRLHQFGGATGHWGGLCSIFEPPAFEKRDWINISGWPITEKEIANYYQRAHETLELGEYSFDLDHWLKRDASLQPLPLDKEVFFSKIWRFGVPESLKFGKRYKDNILQSKNIHLYTYANAVNIVATENIAKIKEVVVKNYEGKTHTVRAKYFVLACCAIQNSRLLLASNTQMATGLANTYDNVGRYFMENIEIKSAGLWLRNKSSLQLYMRNSPNFRAELAVSFKKQQELKILNGILSFTPLSTARKTPPFISTWTDEDPRKDREKMGEIFENAEESGIESLFSSKQYESFEVTMRLEQAPNPLSRITLDCEKDELGVPRASLNWTFTSLEKRSARSIYKLLGQQIGIAGIGRIKLDDSMINERDDTMPANTSGGWHHMGTTRMSNDPKRGVVDADCKVHGIQNLYIAGSSCFPNGGAVNPTFSIVALSIRLSDHLRKMIQAESIINNFAKVRRKRR